MPSDVATSERVWNEVIERRQRVWNCAVRTGRAEHSAVGSQNGAVRARNQRHDQRLGSGAGPLLQNGKGDFVGREALEQAAAAGLHRTLVGLEMVERGIARDGYRCFDESGNAIGVVTSGSPSPTLGKNIALAYVPPALSGIGTTILVEIRTQKCKAQVVTTPFYKRLRKAIAQIQINTREWLMGYPTTYRYTKEHEWIDAKGDIRARSASPIMRSMNWATSCSSNCRQPEPKLTAGKTFGSVESVKAVSEIYAPASGEVVEANAELADKPETINSDPHGAGMVGENEAGESRRTERLDGCGGVRGLHRGKAEGSLGLMRYLPKSPAERAGNAGGDWREIGRRIIFVHSRGIPTEKTTEIAGAAFRSRSNRYFQERGGGKFAWATPVFWARAFTPHLRSVVTDAIIAARRISDFLHALSGGNRARHTAGDIRIPNIDVPVDRAGSGERFDV